MKNKQTINGGPHENGTSAEPGGIFQASRRLQPHPFRALLLNRNRIKEIGIVVIAWLFALALVYMVIVKISILSK